MSVNSVCGASPYYFGNQYVDPSIYGYSDPAVTPFGYGYPTNGCLQPEGYPPEIGGTPFAPIQYGMGITPYAGDVMLKAPLDDLYDSITRNNSSLIPSRWNEFKEQYTLSPEFQMINRMYGGALNDKQINDIVANKFETMTGQNIKALIDQEAHGNFISGFINGMTIGFAQDASTTKLKDKLFKCEEPNGSKFVRTLGSVAGGAAAGAAIGTVIPGIGTAVGAVVGGAIGFISKIWSP